MNRSTLTFVTLAALLGGFALAAQTPSQDPLVKEVERLRGEVFELKQRIQSQGDVGAELRRLSELQGQTVKYLTRQGEAAASLGEKLGESEAKGFTFGINPDSRIALLAGLNTFSETLRQEVPGTQGTAAGGEQR
jgi:hypothetical protein